LSVDTAAIGADRRAQPMLPTVREILSVSPETDDVFTLRLAGPGEGTRPAFAPGQFNMLYVFGVGESAISVSGDPAQPRELVHTVRAVGTVTRAMQRLRRGATIGVRGPYGNAWPLSEARGRDVILVAGGIGLAPLRPAIHEILRNRADYGKVAILYGARTPRELLYAKEIERWRGRFDTQVLVTVDRAERDWYGHVGVVTGLIPLAEIDPQRAIAMICGPEIMMRFTTRELARRGLVEEQIHVSMERNMKCGWGACGHCQMGPFFVCKDGPVFRLDRVSRLLGVREV
jgi:NAD(P)H-flavin reductase